MNPEQQDKSKQTGTEENENFDEDNGKTTVYAVASGKNRGIYTSWQDAREQVNGYPGQNYKKLESEKEGKRYIKDYEETMLANAKGIAVDGLVNKMEAMAIKAQSGDFYVVAVGRETGIFHSWSIAGPLVYKFPNAKHKKFKTEDEANKYLEENKINKEPNNNLLDENKPPVTFSPDDTDISYSSGMDSSASMIRSSADKNGVIRYRDSSTGRYVKKPFS